MQVDDMQGLACDEQAWAVEHFLLNDPKVQQQLFKYLILPAKDLEKDGMPSNANQDQQQSWILQKAAADYTAFVASTAQLALLICPGSTVDHLQPEAAGIIIVEQYAKQLGHSLQQWTDSTVALANIKQVLDGLAWHQLPGILRRQPSLLLLLLNESGQGPSAEKPAKQSLLCAQQDCCHPEAG